jgi:hypothetical protein
MDKDQITLNITLTPEEHERVEEKARRRGYNTPDEYVRALIEADVMSADEVDYEDDDETILEGIREGLRDALSGNVRPISELWDSLDNEE